ncbi:hypothetical protein ACFVXG_03965 [Kitasatospora sp. NPDC058162]|uniref:hypothetical protein n=1 Tax=Kitasatospora sp. NPDC058162 TaxID=3346362 RepID=UPI0036DD08AC
MRPAGPVSRIRASLTAVTATAAAVAATAIGLAAPPAAAAPTTASTAATALRPGDSCTTVDLGTRRPYIKTTEVTPTITHFKGWYVTAGTTGTQTVSTSTQTVIAVSVGLTGNAEGKFGIDALTSVGVSLGLNVKVDFTSTSTESNSLTWNFNQPGYYGAYKGTKKVTGTYGSLYCNRAQQGDGSWALKWVEGPRNGNFTTYTTLEEGVVRCQDKVPADSIMARAQDLLACGSAAAKAAHPAGAVAPTAEQERDRSAPVQAAAGDASADQPKAPGVAARALALDCTPGAYRIDVPGRVLNWSAPLLANDGVRLRESTFFSAHLDNWRLCNVTENNGILEATLWNWGNGGCATIPAGIADQEQAYLTTANCGEDDLQRFYVYRDVPGSSKVGIQNKYTGSMMSYDRYADGELIRQYASGQPNGTGTFTMTGV